ncbi:hypothetical protein F4809DRAFT_31737 [Biscogniauxia mediterranea]|nr:hypothetical protein F4809DRAFT_31737 [Biscogniauxia mediterranea]
MADESFASTSMPTVTGRDSGNAPPGFTLRRAATVGQSAHFRRRPAMNNNTNNTNNINNTTPPLAGESDPLTTTRRRSSLYSDYSLNDARRDIETSADELFNPSRSHLKVDKKSPFAYVPLTLALLPALAGMFFENGSAFFTDLILLSLAAVFLHWSVTQPWDWYQSAQQVRIVKDELMTGAVFESSSDSDVEQTPSVTTAPENAAPDNETSTHKESEEPPSRSTASNKRKQWEIRQAAAIRELYIHEMLALVWCFISPLLGAYLLHTIRGQLTRPSEGLVSDYNLTIFLCAAEVRPISHLIRMLQDRTLHVQQLVARNPYHDEEQQPHHPVISAEQFQALCGRLDDLETAHISSSSAPAPPAPAVPQRALDAAVTRELRATVQPELDALNRAMRRYEKKLTLLASQTDNRIEYVDYRLNDAIALAAVAAKNNNSGFLFGGWLAAGVTQLLDCALAVCALPLRAAIAVCTFPSRTAGMLFVGRGEEVAGGSRDKGRERGKGKEKERSLKAGARERDRVPPRTSSRR